MKFEELEIKIDKICEEVDGLIANDITTVERTGSFLYQIDAYGNDPQDHAQYQAMIEFIEQLEKEDEEEE